MKTPVKKLLFFLSFLLIVGCAYYNTFFNAKMNYKQALEKQKNTQSNRRISGDIKQKYQKAIDKSWKLIKVYGDSNEYADDALLLIGKAYYQLQEYTKAERTLSQFLLKYFKSEHIPEVKLWLARTYIAQERKDDALNILNELLAQKLERRLAAEAFYILGELYYEQEDYEEAIKFLTRSVEVTKDDEMKGNALFMIGEAYYSIDEYENAIDNYDKLTKLDIPPVREYEALAKKIESLIELEKYDEAEIILKKMLSSPRFKKQFSLIETRLANLYEIQGQVDLARDYYYEIIKKYPRSEGAALSNYYLGQLYEYEYANFDSAKVYYEKVKNLKSRPEAMQDARKKVKLLKEYLKIRDQLRKDYADLIKIERGDSVLTDSVEVADDSVAVNPKNQKQTQAPTFYDVAEEKQKMQDTGKQNEFIQSGKELSKEDSLKLAKKKKKIKKKPKKVLVSRNPEEVNKSFKKYSFAKGEYFLLKYQNYDSAAASYNKFIKLFDDSVLTPKAYYALYFIYNNLKQDSIKADSIKQLIISKYPNTIYGKKLRGIVDEKVQVEEVSQSKTLYRQAEDLMENKKYDQALKIFRSVAAQDSGSIWAQKSRYAIAYIYEKYLNDIDKAVKAYTEIVKEYPKSKFAIIAKKKIAPPPPPPEPEKIPEDAQQENKKELPGSVQKPVKDAPKTKKEPVIREEDEH